MKVIVVEPMKEPYLKGIDGSLESMHEIVGGYIEATYPFDEPIALVCDEEGVLKGYPLNRTITPYMTISGTFFLCGLGEEDFESIPEDLIEKYLNRFRAIEVFV